MLVMMRTDDGRWRMMRPDVKMFRFPLNVYRGKIAFYANKWDRPWSASRIEATNCSVFDLILSGTLCKGTLCALLAFMESTREDVIRVILLDDSMMFRMYFPFCIIKRGAFSITFYEARLRTVHTSSYQLEMMQQRRQSHNFPLTLWMLQTSNY